jgi:hypothetical protein
MSEISFQSFQKRRQDDENKKADHDGKNNHKKFQYADEATKNIWRRKCHAIGAIQDCATSFNR